MTQGLRGSAGTVCTVRGCGQKAKSRGWCSGHYNRWQKYGNPAGAGTSNQFRAVILQIAQRGMTAAELAGEANTTPDAACSRIRYWRLQGLIEALPGAAPQKGRPRRYVLTAAGRRELAILHGARADQYDAVTDLAAALGYRPTEGASHAARETR